MTWLYLAASQLVALALGGAFVAALTPRGAGAATTIVGYGYALGIVAVTVILRGMSVAGVAWTFWSPALVALVLAAALAVAAWRWRGVAPAHEGRDTRNWRGRLVALFWGLIAVHVAFALNEALLRPLFPWDAAAQWATKARVWFEYRRLVSFVDPMTWVTAHGNIFTDAHPTYPSTIPLMQVWAALAWGSFDDAVMNVTWPLLLVAVGLGVHGQLRRIGFSELAAVGVAYVIVSMPLLNAHAAIAGYADLAVAVFYVFAFLAFAEWLKHRDWRAAALVVACAITLPTLKMPGWIWLATLPAGVVAAFVPRRVLGMLVIIVLCGLAGMLGYAARNGPIPLLGYLIGPQPGQTAAALASNLFLFANWHLLGFMLPVALIAARRVLLAPSLLPLSIIAGAATFSLAFVYFFTNANAEGVNAYTTVNRAALHIVPMLVVYVALALREAWRVHEARAQSAAAPIPAAPIPAAR